MLKLLNYQSDAIKLMLNMRFCILADEPGLGKTIQSIGLINEKKYKKIIIVCPATLKENWSIECKKWLTHKLNIQIIKTSKCILASTTNIVIINYDLVYKDCILDQLISYTYDLLICDESHMMKNLKSKRTKAVLFGPRSLFRNSNQQLMLTGTPFINTPADIYPVLKVGLREKLRPYGNFYVFTKHFCGGYTDRYSRWVYKTATNTEQLRSLIKPYIIRRLKKDVLKDLPDKFYQQIFLSTDATSKRLIKQEKNMLKDLEAKGVRNLQFSEIASIRKSLGEHKSDFVVEHAKNILDNSQEKIVIFAHHKSVISHIKKELLCYDVTVIDGETPISERVKNVLLFQDNSKCRVIICNIIAGGVGITLTSASTVIFAELPWTAAEVHQAVDRCHRIGQTKSVCVQFLVFADSLDANIVSKIIYKENMIKQLI